MTDAFERGSAAVGPPATVALPHVPPLAADLSRAPWLTVADGRGGPDSGERPIRLRRVFGQVVAAGLAVLLVVAVGGLYASRKVAERQAVNDAAQTTDLLADAALQPALEDALLTGTPAALGRLDQAVRTRVIGHGVVRVKVWTPQGRVLYSDEARVIGSTFALGADEQAVLAERTTRAEVSDLSRPENVYERGNGPLLEVYRPVWTPSGQPLLFETYLAYDSVTTRSGQLWRGFAGITVSSLLLLLVLMLPILWRLLDRVRSAQDQRVALLQHAVDASSDERARIAATLHDGVVQELAAASFAVAGAAERAATVGQPALADMLRAAASAVRGTIGGLRSLLVDIYPPSLRTAGLSAALSDLAGTVRSRDIRCTLDLPADGRTGLDEEGERLVFRVAQESLRNVARHASATEVTLALAVSQESATLTVSDDGIGFDAAQTLARPPEGHLGLRVMSDLAERSGALLQVASSPGAGTRWRLVVPRR